MFQEEALNFLFTVPGVNLSAVLRNVGFSIVFSNQELPYYQLLYVWVQFYAL